MTHWVDQIVDQILQTYPNQNHFVVRDEKTLSGRVHVGSLRGVIIHGIIAQVLEERGKSVEFIFEFNDFDPMDNINYPEYLGKPLCEVPAIDSTFVNFPEQWGTELKNVINVLGFYPTFPRLSHLYQNGHFDKWFEIGINQANKIREIYRRISGSQKDDNWTPISGHKLAWKLEWPAKWDVYNVDIEGGGKDHCSAGGSRDIGEAICKEITGTKIPFNIPYEFFLVDGKKMSSSKGIGTSAREIADLLPPEILRFLMLKSPPNRPINFDPTGDTIPRLLDQYDQEMKNRTRLWELCNVRS